jgi:hypothetical protein
MENMKSQSSDPKSLTTYTQQEVQQYLDNKSRGARNFSKGANYENCFAVHLLASLSKLYFEQEADHYVIAQYPQFFVDDLVVKSNETKRFNCYQLKNVQELGWGDGNKGSLLFDFYYQMQKTLEYQQKLFLVVSNQELSKKLESKMPTQLRDQTNVTFFPVIKPGLLYNEPKTKAALCAIASDPEPTRDLLEGLVKLIFAEWVSHEGNLSISTLLSKIEPSYVRASGTDEAASAILQDDVRQILANVQGFAFRVAR